MTVWIPNPDSSYVLSIVRDVAPSLAPYVEHIQKHQRLVLVALALLLVKKAIQPVWDIISARWRQYVEDHMPAFISGKTQRSRKRRS